MPLPCAADIALYQCPTPLPSTFCCALGTNCLTLQPTNASIQAAALCCPAGSDCQTITPVGCFASEQNYTLNTLHVLPPQELEPCGLLGCCPPGYACQGRLCVARKVPRAATARSSGKDVGGVTSTSAARSQASQSSQTQPASSTPSAPSRKSKNTSQSTSTPTPLPATPIPSHPPSSSTTTKALTATLTTLASLLLLGAACTYIYLRRRRSRASHHNSNNTSKLLVYEQSGMAGASSREEEKAVHAAPVELGARVAERELVRVAEEWWRERARFWNSAGGQEGLVELDTSP